MIISIDVSGYYLESEASMLRKMFNYDEKLQNCFLYTTSSTVVGSDAYDYTFDDDSTDLQYIKDNYPDLLI